ncbi:hypothetical protein ACQEVZ_60625 [Dactylosporangium sp. CA-152071]|uniref:hypothetical protein n=1 Tax=Dactylosporangium sp. CA-152071 TaxID=3239933 RepID=UPI003D8FD64A
MALDAKIILPPCDFSDDEEFLAWLEVCRLTGIKANDETSENAAYVYAKLRRYAKSRGLGGFAAARTARSVSLPIARAADSMGNFSGYMRLAGRRFEAFVEAVERPQNRGTADFQIKGSRR